MDINHPSTYKILFAKGLSAHELHTQYVHGRKARDQIFSSHGNCSNHIDSTTVSYTDALIAIKAWNISNQTMHEVGCVDTLKLKPTTQRPLNYMRGSRGVGDLPMEIHKAIEFLSNTGPDPPGKSQNYQASIQCWAITGPPAKRHL